MDGTKSKRSRRSQNYKIPAQPHSFHVVKDLLDELRKEASNKNESMSEIVNKILANRYGKIID